MQRLGEEPLKLGIPVPQGVDLLLMGDVAGGGRRDLDLHRSD